MPTRRFMRLLLFGLMLVLVASGVTASQDDVATDGEEEVLQVPLFTDLSPSGCETCADRGDCTHAYLDGPGQFCGNWLDRASHRQRCCCPREAVCDVSNYSCKCQAPRSEPESTSRMNGRLDSFLMRFGSILGSIGVLFLAASVLWCLCPCCRARGYSTIARPMSPVIPQATPVCELGYGQGYSSGYSRGGMGAGSSAMMGGVAGLFGGVLLGEAIADAGHSHDDFPGGTCDPMGGVDEFGGDF